MASPVPNRPRSKPWRTQGGIRIRPLRNRSGSFSYRAEIPESITGRRLLRQFKTPEEAEAFASIMVVQRQNNGLAAFALSDRQRSEARLAFDLLKDSPGVSLAEAVRFFLRHHRPAGGDLSVEQLVGKFLAEKRRQNLRPRSLQDLTNRLGVFVRDFGPELVKNLSTERLREWLWADPARSPQTRLNFKRILHGFFGFGVKERYCALNPVTAIEIRVESAEPGILTVAQAEWLLLTALKRPELGLGPFLTLGLFCGIRSEELSKLEWKEVNFGEGFVTISKRIAKKRRIRNVPLEENAALWLRAFGGPAAGLVAPAHVTSRLGTLVALAGRTAAAAQPPVPWFESWPINGLRHSFASYFFARTSKAAETCARLGQRSDEVLFQHYRSLVRKADAERFFLLRPPAEANIVPQPAPAG